MLSDLGSPALAKVREAVMGPNGNNLDDLVRLDGITLKTFDLNGFLYFYISAFLHTGDLEAVNALLLKYLPKKIAFRFVKIRESLICTALLRSEYWHPNIFVYSNSIYSVPSTWIRSSLAAMDHNINMNIDR